MEKVKQDTMLGLVFFGGLGLLIWATAQLTSISFADKPTLVVWFENASGLAKGDPVFVLGTRNGQVSAVDLMPDEVPRIRVTLELEQYVSLKRDARIRISDANLLGGRQVDVDPGSGAVAWAAERRIAGDTPKGIVDSLGEADIAGLVDSMKTVFDRMNDPTGNVGAMLSERVVYDDLAASARMLKESLEAVSEQRGFIGRAIYDPVTGDSLVDILVEVRDFVRSLNQSGSVLHLLLREPQMGEAVAGTIMDIRQLVADVRAGRGLVGRMMDETVGQELADSVTALASVMRKLDDPAAGVFGALLGEPSWRGSMQDMLLDLADFARKMNQGVGLLAQLVNDPTLPVKLTRVLNQVARAIEDAREAAPVSTFIQVFAAVGG